MAINKKLFKSLGGVVKTLPKISPKNLKIALILITALALGYLGRSLIFAASVNGEFITRLKLISELEKQGGSQTLDSLVTKALIFQEAKNKGITLSKEELDSEITRIEGIVSQQGTTLDEALALQGQTRSDLLEQIKLQKTVERLLADKLGVSDEEVKTYFDENKDVYGPDAKFDEVKEKIKTQIIQEKLTSAYQTWIAELKKNAKVNYFVDFK